MNYYNRIYFKKVINLIFFSTILLSLTPTSFNSSKALEFQWDSSSDYKKLTWHQTNSEKKSRNKIFLFYRPSDRKSGILSINVKIPDNFKSNLKPKNISFCKVNIGGFDSKTKCLKKIPSDIEINKEDKKVEIFPISPVPANRWVIVEPIAPFLLNGRFAGSDGQKEVGPLCIISMPGSECSANIVVSADRNDLSIGRTGGSKPTTRNKQCVIDQLIRKSVKREQVNQLTVPPNLSSDDIILSYSALDVKR